MGFDRFYRSIVERNITQRGATYTFSRPSLDKFGQLTDEESIQIELKGIYHEQTSYLQKVTSDGTITCKKKKPMILTLEDGALICTDDKVIIKGKVFKVIGISDVQQFSTVYDISLEEEVNSNGRQ